MRILIRASVLILFSALSVHAQNDLRAVYSDGSVRNLPKNITGTLSANDEGELTFVSEKARWQAPYPQVKTIYVSLSRRSALGEVFGLAGAAVGAAKKRKLLMSIITTDSAGKSVRAVFELLDVIPGGFVEALEKKTGRKIVFESEEARQAVKVQQE